MKKITFIAQIATLIFALNLSISHAQTDPRDFDGDGDIDGDDLSTFVEKFGAVAWYKDADGDGYSDGVALYAVSQPPNYYSATTLFDITGDCDDGNSEVNPGAIEFIPNGTCNDSLDNDCDGLIDQEDTGCARAPLTGEIIISEMMINPDALADTVGEYFELYNTTADSLSLTDCTLSDFGIDSHPINNELIIMPDSYLVLAPSSIALGGGSPDYVYSDFVLANSGDEVVLTCNSQLIDQVAYSNTSWFITPGYSLNLDPFSFDSVINDDSGSWCNSSTQYSTGDYGTPGQENNLCTGGAALMLGEACIDNMECQSGFCVDGVCCNTSCLGLCESCSNQGYDGTCSAIPYGADPDEECLGLDVCSGFSSCTPL